MICSGAFCLYLDLVEVWKCVDGVHHVIYYGGCGSGLHHAFVLPLSPSLSPSPLSPPPSLSLSPPLSLPLSPSSPSLPLPPSCTPQMNNLHDLHLVTGATPLPPPPPPPQMNENHCNCRMRCWPSLWSTTTGSTTPPMSPWRWSSGRLGTRCLVEPLPQDFLRKYIIYSKKYRPE